MYCNKDCRNYNESYGVNTYFALVYHRYFDDNC